MKCFAFIIAVVVLQLSGIAEACGRCRAGHARPQRVASQPRPMAYQAPIYHPSPVAAPQMAYALPNTPVQPMATLPTISPRPSGDLQPSYNYAANPAQPAYYYTYDNSGKLVVSQWVDYLFRGGRAEGMPRPPLPVVGALRNRN